MGSGSALDSLLGQAVVGVEDGQQRPADVAHAQLLLGRIPQLLGRGVGGVEVERGRLGPGVHDALLQRHKGRGGGGREKDRNRKTKRKEETQGDAKVNLSTSARMSDGRGYAYACRGDSSVHSCVFMLNTAVRYASKIDTRVL